MGILIVLLIVAAVIWWFWPSKQSKQGRPIPTATQPAPKPKSCSPSRTHPGTDSSSKALDPVMRFAEPGKTGKLFSYGGPSSGKGYVHDGPFAVIDVETTGFSPVNGDRVIEIAVARVDRNGRIEDEYSTLLNPEGRDTGAVFIHGISNDAVRNAPYFADVVGDILSRLEGTVIVAHNAVFEERFLAAEFGRAGIATPLMPALCSLWLGQQTFDTPNHKLATLAQHAGIALVDAHAALGDVRATSALLPMMLERFDGGIEFGHPPAYGLGARHRPGTVTPMTRAVALRKGTDGWMSSLMSRLPISTGEVSDAAAAAYLDALVSAVEDGKIVGEEAKLLARIAGNGGMGAAQVRGLNERFLEMMREAALSDQILTPGELTELNRTALLLGTPGYFDDLTATPVDLRGEGPGIGPESSPANKPRTPRRCGHCRAPGHYRSNCPDLS